MIAFASMLAACAKAANMPVPEDLDNFDPTVYPHWQVYLNVQLGAPLPYPSAHWDNAKVIAAISVEDIFTVTYDQLVDDHGVAVGFSIP